MMRKTSSGSSSTSGSGGSENDAPTMLSSEDIYAATPIVDGNNMKIVVPLHRMIGKDGVVSPVRIEVPIPRTLLVPSGKWPDHAQLLVQNHMNFKESGKPVKFMCYKDGEWVNFGKNLSYALISAFVSGKPMYEVEMEGFKFIFDFYRMLGMDFVTGTEMFISWIDINGRCFFPKYVDKNFSSEDRNIELEIRNTENMNSTGEELGKRKRRIEENEVEMGECSSFNVNERRAVATELLRPKWSRTRSLREEERLYQMVKGLIFSFLKAGVTVTGVHQCIRTSPVEQVRFEVFQNTVKRARRKPNVVEYYAWHGTSSKNVDSIMRRGFEMSTIVRGSHTHGVGIYLSPVHSPQDSAMTAEIDENGEKHIMLCQVISGNLENLELEYQQPSRSSANFDTGVDDSNNPNLFVVWCGKNVNTHILPVCIVSFKYGHDMSGRLNGARHAHNAWSTLLSNLSSWLPPLKMLELQSLFGSYREGKVGKEIFMRQLRSVVADEFLRSIILETRG